MRATVLTISSSIARGESEDVSGPALVELCEQAGLEVTHEVVSDDREQIKLALARHADQLGARFIFTTGGTGISSRDSTYEAVSALLWKRLDGFGELFRMLSYEQIGSAAMLSRACAGLVAGRVVVALPGSEAAVRLAMERLLIPELGHLVREASR